MTKKILDYGDAERAVKDPIIAAIHRELLKLELVKFDSGYAGLMQGARLSEDS